MSNICWPEPPLLCDRQDCGPDFPKNSMSLLAPWLFNPPHFSLLISIKSMGYELGDEQASLGGLDKLEKWHTSVTPDPTGYYTTPMSWI
jgi:hypothetical protein